MQDFQWRASPDGARLAFVALHNQDPILCTAALADGSDLQLLPPEGLPMLLPRYFLQGRYATVPADAVSVSIWRAHYRVPFPQWPALMPPGGPWERMLK